MRNHQVLILRNFNCLNKGHFGIRRLSCSNLITKDVENKFQSSLHKIIDDFFDKRQCLQSSGIKKHIEMSSKYNLRAGNNVGSMILLHAYHILGNSDQISDEDFHQACILAWAIEMMNSYYLMLQNSDKRVEDITISIFPEIKTSGTSEATLLYSFAYSLLEESLVKHASYKDLMRFFNKGFFYTAIGKCWHPTCQQANTATTTSKTNKFVDFNVKQYESLCGYTGYRNFKLPLFLAMKLTNINDDTLYKQMDDIGSNLSILRQIQEDYQDCFGAPNKGYAGTDIQNGKLTWLATEAVQRCTPAQRVVFQACYGSHEPAHYERVKRLYEQLGLPQICKELEDSIYENIAKQAKAFESYNVPPELFLNIINVLRANKK